ncbi:HAD-IIB family hydrolase [Psychromarinibacter sp. S121]|uniref:HAD-IIB family hydrolase n=1 Tax=Psychromarinibacter sp. S121 TaxID=3415127 RepID=UPI003C7C2264
MRLVIFTDLDGTLLDHDTYSHAPAAQALAALKAAGVPLVLASSKTGAEMAPLHAELGLGDAPMIVENGAGVLEPGADGAGDAAYRKIRAALDSVPPDLRAHYRGFGDMTDAEVSDVTGLPPEGAALARQRCHSEPGVWSGDDAALARFLDALDGQGVSARHGGRFLTLSLGRTKADAMREVADRLGADTTIALGDAPNDVEMLEQATHGVIVRNDHGTPLPRLAGEENDRIRRTAETGPSGWNAAVLALLQDLGATTG